MLIHQIEYPSTMPSHVQDDLPATDELLRDLIDPSLNGYDSQWCDPLEEVDFSEWLQNPENVGNLDTSSRCARYR